MNFEQWCDLTERDPSDRDLYSAWQASRTAALEEAYQAANNESLTDHTGHPEDIAYNGAIRDCLDAIRALAKEASC